MQQQGCMKYTMYLLPLISVYFSYVMPGAIGFYWVISSLTGFIQSVVTNKFYGPQTLTAKTEAQRVALRLQEETAIRALPLGEQKQLEEKLLFAQRGAVQNKEKTQKKGAQKKKKPTGSKGGADNYLGSKK